MRKSTKLSLSMTAATMLLSGIVAGAVYAPMLEESADAQKVLELKEDVSADSEDGKTAENAPYRSIDWDSLASLNPQCAAWVEIPGTNVNYPLVQALPGDGDLWLHRMFDGTASDVGAPYIDEGCSSTGSVDGGLVTAYGHNLIDGTMFADIARCSDAAFAQGHRDVYVHTEDSTRVLTVLGADVVDANRETIETGIQDVSDAVRYAKERLAQADVLISEPVDGKPVWAFVSCSYQTSNSRTILYAQEVERKR